jgi:hypothetical protein
MCGCRGSVKCGFHAPKVERRGGMRFSLSFDMDGAAFDGGDNSVDEVCRILHTVAERMDADGVYVADGLVRDINGNTIGKWEVLPETE